MLPYAKRNMPRGWIFQQDNDPKYSSRYVKEYFNKQKIKVLEWPSRSPDLNSIEHMWKELDRRIRIRNFTNKNEFFTALKTEWSKIPFDRISKLIDSMPRRCKAVISANGYATKY